MTKVQVIYRNYKPIHQLFFSYQYQPVQGIEYLFPKTKSIPSFLRPLYIKLREHRFISKTVQLGEKLLFSSLPKNDADVLEYLHLIPLEIPKKPYVINFEHPFALSYFVKPSKEMKAHIEKFLFHPNCKSIITFSYAALSPLKGFLGDAYSQIQDRVHVVYPALPNLTELYRKSVDTSLIKDFNSFHILFVGAPDKGLIDLLQATKVLVEEGMDISTHIVSKDLPEKFLSLFTQKTHLYSPNFSKEEIVGKLLIPSNLVIHPTRRDTFGMIVLEALASGTPVISTKQYAIPELVEHKKDGWLMPIERPILDNEIYPTHKQFYTQYNYNQPDERMVEGLKRYIREAVQKPELLKRMGQNALKKFAALGKFSIETRNAKLKEIYKKALS